jgi:hypothetical protein
MQAAMARLYASGQAPQYSGQEGRWRPNLPVATAPTAPLATNLLQAVHGAHRPLLGKAQGSGMAQGVGVYRVLPLFTKKMIFTHDRRVY